MDAVWEELQEAYEAGFDARREVYGEDYCDLIRVTVGNDGSGGAVETRTVLRSKAECFYTARTQTVSVFAGGNMVILTHDVTLKANSASRSLRQGDLLLVRKREDREEFIFENLLVRSGSFAPLVELSASVRQ